MGVTESGVITWVPETCPDGSAPHTSNTSANWQDAQDFDVTSSAYYKKLVPNVIAGIVFGVLGVLGFLFFLIWMCVQCCRARKRRRAKEAEDDPSAHDQFISTAASYQSAYVPPPPGTVRRRFSWGRFLKVFMVAVGLASTGVCIWGAVESSRWTSHTVSDFWAIEDNISNFLVKRAKEDVEKLDTGVTQVLTGLEFWSNQTDAVNQALVAQGVNSTIVSNLNAAAEALPQVLRGYQEALVSSLRLIGGTVYDALKELESNFEAPSLAFQEKWRFIPIMVLFCTGAVLGVLVSALAWPMRFYKTASAFTSVLWLNVALLMLLGVGLLNGLYVVSGDACLYTETFVLNYANKKVSDPDTRTLVDNALRYYFGATNYSDTELLTQVTGVNLSGLLGELDKVPFDSAAAALNSSSFGANSALLSQNKDVLASMLTGFDAAVGKDLANLTYRSSVDPVYHQGKEFLCCSLNNTAQDLWVAWTVAGCLLFVYATLVTARIISHTFSTKTRRRDAAAVPVVAYGSAPTAPAYVAAGEGGGPRGEPHV